MCKEHYEYIHANIDCGELTWKYKLRESDVPGTWSHDEDVSAWTDEEIVAVTCATLDVDEDERELVEVMWH